jgi:hypothetical protein
LCEIINVREEVVMRTYLSILIFGAATLMITACGTYYPPVFDSRRTSFIFSFDAPVLAVMKE